MPANDYTPDQRELVDVYVAHVARVTGEGHRDRARAEAERGLAQVRAEALDDMAAILTGAVAFLAEQEPPAWTRGALWARDAVKRQHDAEAKRADTITQGDTP